MLYLVHVNFPVQQISSCERAICFKRRKRIPFERRRFFAVRKSIQQAVRKVMDNSPISLLLRVILCNGFWKFTVQFVFQSITPRNWCSCKIIYNYLQAQKIPQIWSYRIQSSQKQTWFYCPLVEMKPSAAGGGVQGPLCTSFRGWFLWSPRARSFETDLGHLHTNWIGKPNGNWCRYHNL